MGNSFDTLASKTFGHVAKVMGYDASWTPSAGGSTLTAKVLFKAPADRYDMGSSGHTVTYNPDQPSFEYKIGDFPGLKESVDETNTEVVTIEGVDYYVRVVDPISDGRHFKATIENV